jgi:hypothetical protein
MGLPGGPQTGGSEGEKRERDRSDHFKHTLPQGPRNGLFNFLMPRMILIKCTQVLGSPFGQF